MNILRTLETYAAAAALAEQGQWESGLALTGVVPAPRAILVAYEAGLCQRRLVEQALGLADRLNAKAVFALTGMAVSGHETDRAAESARFRKTLDALGTRWRNAPVTHMYRPEELYTATTALCREIRGLTLAVLACASGRERPFSLTLPYFFFR